MNRTLFEVFTPSASKKVMLIVAGLIWTTASFILLFKGLLYFETDISHFALKFLVFLLIFIFFYKMLFVKVSLRYLNRIISLKKDRPCIFSFFNFRGYILMIFMMGLGIGLRNLKFIPLSWLSCLYFGVGIPLFISSIRFYIAGVKFKKDL
jgi:hypothetical protein